MAAPLNAITALARTTQAAGPVAGSATKLRGASAVIQGYLDANGGSATIKVYARLGVGSQWSLRYTLSLSGANDHAEAIIDREPWGEIYADITAISGGSAVAVCEVGMEG